MFTREDRSPEKNKSGALATLRNLHGKAETVHKQQFATLGLYVFNGGKMQKRPATNGGGAAVTDRTCAILLDLLALNDFDLIPEGCVRNVDIFVLEVEPKLVSLRCPKCGSRDVRRNGYVGRWSIIAHPPFGTTKLKLRLRKPRIQCRDCKKSTIPILNGLLPGQRCSEAMSEFLLAKYKLRQTFAEIACESGIPETTTARRLKKKVDDIDSSRGKKLPRSIGLDDVFRVGAAKHTAGLSRDRISTDQPDKKIKKTQDDTPATVIGDNQTGTIIELVPSTSIYALSVCLASCEGNKEVEEFTSDGGASFVAVGRKNFPGAIRMLDRWHINKNLLESLASARAAYLPFKAKNREKPDGPNHTQKISTPEIPEGNGDAE